MNKPDYIAVKELVDFIVDNRGKTVPTVEEGIPLIATNCIKEESIYPIYEKVRFISQSTYDSWFRSHLEPNDILFVNKGTPGRACLVPNPVEFVAAQDMVGLRFKNEYNPYYMLAVIRSKEIQKTISNNHVGLVIPHFRKQELLTLKLPILKKDVRNSIGQSYKSISEKIEVNNKINQELEALAKTIYDYWFVQFDFPDQNGKPYKSSGGKMLYNEALKREIPEGWAVKELKEIESNIITGKTPSTKVEENFGGEIPFITIDDIRQSRFIYSAERTLSKLGAETQSNKYLEEYDICVSCIGTVGVIGFVGKKAQSNQQINTIAKPKDYNRYYLFQYLNDYFNFNTAAKKGAVLSNMNKGEFEAIPVIEPNKDLRQLYFDNVDDIFKAISNNIKQNQKLAALRDWLLPMLMNGQVTVKSPDEVRAQDKKILNQVQDDNKQVQDNKLGRVAEDEEEYKVNK